MPVALTTAKPPPVNPDPVAMPSNRPSTIVPSFALRAMLKQPLAVARRTEPFKVLRPTRNPVQLSLFERPTGAR